MRIAIIEPVGGHGGNDLYALNLCSSIYQKGMEVTYITCDETFISENTDFQFPIKKYFRKIYVGNKYIKGMRFLIGVIRSFLYGKINNVKVAHFHLFGYSFLTYYSILLFQKGGFKIVATIHDVEAFDSKVESKSITKYFNVVNAIIVHTKFAKSLIKNYKIAPNIDIYIVPNSDIDNVYNKNVSQNEALKKLGLDLNFKYILFFGQIKEVKGLEILIRALPKITKNRDDVKLIIAGKFWRDNKKRYIDLIESLDISTRVIFRDSYIINEIVPLYFKAAEMVVLPYKKIYNSGVMLRSLYYGAITLTSDLPPFKETIINEYNGFIFKSEDVSDLERKIINILNRNDLENIRKNAIQTITKNHSINNIGNLMKNIYSTLKK